MALRLLALRQSQWTRVAHQTGRNLQLTRSLFKSSQTMQRLFDNNKKWRDGKKLLDPNYFDKTAKNQHPQYLWIGCSDSRVPSEEITGLSPGEMFVHRNIANMVVTNDMSSLSVIQYAVEHLKVKDIIICGHYGCGGVKASVAKQHLGILDEWLRNLRDVTRIHMDELDEIKDPDERLKRLIEFNTMEQCINVFKIGFVQRHQLKYGFPRIHGVIYDMHNGQLKELDIDFQTYVNKYKSVYRLHSLPAHSDAFTRAQLQANMVFTLSEGHEEEAGRVSTKYLFKAMTKEPELFSQTEIEAAIKYAIETDDSFVSDGKTVAIVRVMDYFED